MQKSGQQAKSVGEWNNSEKDVRMKFRLQRYNKRTDNTAMPGTLQQERRNYCRKRRLQHRVQNCTMAKTKKQKPAFASWYLSDAEKTPFYNVNDQRRV